MLTFLDSPAHLLALGSLTLLSLADLRFRALPGIKIFFVCAALFGILAASWKVWGMLLVVGWGSQPRAPIGWIIPAMFFPALWPVILTASGTRKNLVAKGDLFALGGMACLLEGDGMLFAFLGVFFWQRVWGRGQEDTVPALPGMLLGVIVYVAWRFFL